MGLDWRVSWSVSLENTHTLIAFLKGSPCLWKLTLACFQMEPDERNFRSWSSPGRSESPVWRTEGENRLLGCVSSSECLECEGDLGSTLQAGSGPLELREQKRCCLGAGTNETEQPTSFRQLETPKLICAGWSLLCLHVHVSGRLFLPVMGFLVEFQSDTSCV